MLAKVPHIDDFKSYLKVLKNYSENTLTSFMADMIFKYNGWSVMSEFATKSTEDNIARKGLSRGYKTGSGIMVAAGYLFNNNVELALRYTNIMADKENASSLADEEEIALGLSKYIVGHSLKIQTDIARTIKNDASDGEIRFRAQVEMQF